MTKPATAPTVPSYLFRANVPHASTALDSLAHDYECAQYPPALVNTLSKVLRKMNAWSARHEADEPPPAWKLLPDVHVISALKRLASTLDQEGGHDALVLELREVAAAMKRHLGLQPAETAIVGDIAVDLLRTDPWSLPCRCDHAENLACPRCQLLARQKEMKREALKQQMAAEAETFGVPSWREDSARLEEKRAKREAKRAADLGDPICVIHMSDGARAVYLDKVPDQEQETVLAEIAVLIRCVARARAAKEGSALRWDSDLEISRIVSDLQGLGATR